MIPAELDELNRCTIIIIFAAFWMECVKKDRNKKIACASSYVMLLINQRLICKCITFRNTFRLCYCWFCFSVLLASVDESMGVRPYWLKKMPLACLPPCGMPVFNSSPLGIGIVCIIWWFDQLLECVKCS